MRFRRLAQVPIRAVVHNCKALGRAPRVVAGPPYNAHIVVCQFDLWPLGDSNARSFLGRGRGAAPQVAGGQGGGGGGGIRVSLPCVAAVPTVMHTPVYVWMSGYGLVKPSESVWRKATIWFSSISVKPSLPMVMSRLLGTSGIGQQSTFSIFPFGQCPEVTSKG